MDIERIIKDMIEENKDLSHYTLSSYESAYTDGCHDALVRLMDELGIKHNEEIIDDLGRANERG